MDDNAAFIRAIAEDPAWDTNRLVYADWLDEHDYPREADYLRTELELAKLPLDAPEAPALRTRLWHAWAAVDPAWLMTFTQPRMLRANPTPFPSAWVNFGLGRLREWEGTYGTWPYDSVPRLPLDELRGEFQYLGAGPTPPGTEADEDSAWYRQMFERNLAIAAENGVRWPESFVRFMSNRALHDTFRSLTDCFFCLPQAESPSRPDLAGEGVHVPFYSDSQGCLEWDLYVHPSGAHCVVARYPDPPDLDDEEPQDPDDEEPQDPNDEEPPDTGPPAWFVAPCFEAFLYRVWVETQVWYIEHADYLRQMGADHLRQMGIRETPPPITPQIQAYMDHYRQQQGRK